MERRLKSRIWLGLIALVGLVAIIAVDRYFRLEAAKADEGVLAQSLTHAAIRLREDIRGRIRAVESLAGFMQASPTMPGFDRFDQFARVLLRGHPTIRGLAFVDRQQVIRHFYPRRGNEAAIGLDLRTRPAAPFVAMAIRERRTTVSHPVRTVQGSLSVIARSPFYRDGRLAGLVQGVFDITPLMHEASEGLDRRIGFTLHDAEGVPFYGESSLPGRTTAVHVRIGDNRWRLTAGWKAGPPGPPLRELTLLWIGGGILLVSLMLLAGRILAREQQLQASVDERTGALSESEALLARSQAHAHIGSWRWEVDSGQITWSVEMCRLHGVGEDQCQPTLEKAMAFLHPDDRPRVEAQIRTMMENKDEEYFEYRMVRPDGDVRHLWARTEVQRNAEGKPVMLIGTIQDVTERVAAEQRLRALLDAVPDLMFRIRADGTYLDVKLSPQIPTLVSPDDFLGRKASEILPPEVAEGSMAAIGRALATGVVQTHTYQLSFEGVVHDYEARIAPCGADEVLGMVRDITDMRQAEARMRQLSGAVEQTADSVLITDRRGVIEYVNPAFERTTGYTRDEAIGQTPNLVKSGRQGKSFYAEMWKTILTGQVFSDVFVNRRKDGSYYFEEKTITPLKDGQGQVTHFVSTGKDVTERMEVQEQLQFLAQHDSLTELPNRLLLLDRLKQSLARARWHERLVAVLFVDLDRFKTINDTLGHEIGDRLLQQLAGRFSRAVREGDTVSRFGGDEFVILLDDVASSNDVSQVAQKVLDALVAPFTVDHHQLYITASIGISLFPNDGEESGALLKYADTAMYRAKDAGRNNYQFYSADMSARAFERLALETSLRNALERQEFVLHYQPQIDAVSGQIFGVEALLRWRHPDLGLVTPAEFISLLEETGLIVPVGEWVLQTAWAQLRTWHAAGWRDLRLSVNLSPRQVQAPGLVNLVGHSLDGLSDNPHRLELEITEGVLVQHEPKTLATLEDLRGLGVRLAIDDFGIGYSSLSYLRRFPIDSLKVDRSFVRDIPVDPDDCAITTTIIAMAQSLRMEAIAEGVETAEQRDFLLSRGCRLMQGFLFGRPQTADEIGELLARGNAAVPRG